MPRHLPNNIFMRTIRIQLITVILAASYLAAFVVGCRPTVREVTEFMYQVPLESSREMLISDLIAKCGDKLPSDMRNDAIINETQPLTLGMVKADQDLILLCQREHRFVRIYPSDIFRKMRQRRACEYGELC